MPRFDSKIMFKECNRGLCDWCGIFTEKLEHIIKRQNDTGEYCADCNPIVKTRFNLDIDKVEQKDLIEPKTKNNTTTTAKSRHKGNRHIFEAQRDEIRKLYVKRPTMKELAKKYNVDVSTIFRIISE